MDMLQEIYNTMDGKMVDAFLERLLKNYKQAEGAGCFADDTNETVRTKIVLRITGENISPISPEYRAELANARHFI